MCATGRYLACVLPVLPTDNNYHRNGRGHGAMSRNSLLLILIIVIIAGAAFAYYQHRQNTLLEVGVGGHTLSIQKN
jgi:hypothetical protein